MSIQLFDGCYGRTRDGHVIGPIRVYPNGVNYRFAIFDDYAAWNDSGKWSCANPAEHSRDIVQVSASLIELAQEGGDL